jgi:hypothetical protein
MNSLPSFSFQKLFVLFFSLALPVAVCPVRVAAQVSANEVLDPTLHALEKDYLPQLKTINQGIARTHFPFPFYLSRVVGLDPAQQVEADTRGLEFVRFKDRVVLKATGNYNAAYDSRQFTRNERGSRTFRDVVLPILQAVTQNIPPTIDCDAVGFEISYHVRERQKSYDYEGKEILVVVLDRDDAFRMVQLTSDEQRQEILNRSLIYMSGDEFGLSLLDKDPLIVDKAARARAKKTEAAAPASAATSGSTSAAHLLHIPPSAEAGGSGGVAAAKQDLSQAKPAATDADSARLAVQYKAQVAAFAKEGEAKFAFVSYDPPAFVVVNKQLALQMTMKNPQKFDAEKSSIYKRAALTFDLFLAPKMADLLVKAPDDEALDAFDFSIVNALASAGKERSEAVEYVVPKGVARQFAASEITNQQLIDRSVVLVNGVRIALNLQLVE